MSNKRRIHDSDLVALRGSTVLSGSPAARKYLRRRNKVGKDGTRLDSSRLLHVPRSIAKALKLRKARGVAA